MLGSQGAWLDDSSYWFPPPQYRTKVPSLEIERIREMIWRWITGSRWRRLQIANRTKAEPALDRRSVSVAIRRTNET